ncbi:protein FAR-RED IMPAIRED RESPONSE 1-like [Camellia sinensis]|uniref:protein FAR-RED IMPAIRED RESPONSE 1-like n=1 Tax=Camellia sinensis TaxID=4442 RepID=UPI001036E907|nr:protein FAR-RED IMPAIRED RESPONSE 1-like [Camellia sinensis]
MVVKAGGYESLTFDERDARNYINRARKLGLGEGDSDALRKYFLRIHAQNSSFYYMIDVDTDFRIRNLFWADAMSRAAYKEFGDVVSFDTTYLTNKYDMPFAPFVGVNHHGQSILLGCGLLSNEDTDTFVWLFKSWLNCMSDHPPKAIITYQCKAMQNAIEIVFPNTRHQWCLWYIMKKIPEKLKGYSQYESMKMDLQNAVYDTFTKDEFEMKWKEMIAKFNLYENQWLGVLYDEWHQWVEKEKKADFKSRHKVFDCLTVYGFEKRFQDAYTNAKFKEVQAEMKRLVYCKLFLVKDGGSICIYFVKEAMEVFGKMKHVDFVVYYNSTEFDVHCMCRLFEFKGIMCAHTLVVLIARCINEVSNKYILPRWRKDLNRGYTCIKTTYTGFGDDFNAKVYDKMNRKLICIVQFAGNSEGKIKLIDRGLDEIKAKVMKDDEGGGSNVAPSTSNVPPITSNVPSSPIDSINRKAISHTKLLSPLVARRKGRPVTKRKVTKVDQIVNRLKASKRKHNKSKGMKVLRGECEDQFQSQPERSACRELYPYMVGMENSMHVSGHMVNAIGGTSLTPTSVDIMRRQSFMNAPTQSYGIDTSLTPSDCIGGTPGFMRTQQSMTATHQIYGAIPSSSVELNVQMDRNDRGSSFR